MGCGIVRYGRVEIWAVGLYGMGELRYGLWDSAVWESWDMGCGIVRYGRVGIWAVG